MIFLWGQSAQKEHNPQITTFDQTIKGQNDTIHLPNIQLTAHL